MAALTFAVMSATSGHPWLDRTVDFGRNRCLPRDGCPLFAGMTTKIKALSPTTLIFAKMLETERFFAMDPKIFRRWLCEIDLLTEGQKVGVRETLAAHPVGAVSVAAVERGVGEDRREPWPMARTGACSAIVASLVGGPSARPREPAFGAAP